MLTAHDRGDTPNFEAPCASRADPATASREVRLGPGASGSGGRIRTYDQAVNSRPLYH